MKSFLENRHAITPNATGPGGVVSKGEGFQKLGSANISKPRPSAFENIENPELVENPNGHDAPKVEFIKSNNTISKIIVSFGDQKVEIDCQY